jgi:glycosyltransferase involved in cell wall biosynthesis
MLVSIAIPFCNNQATLARGIRSVFAQTFTDWELILLDDGSRDDSMAIAKSVSHPNVRVFSDGQNRGLVYRLNQAAALAKGSLLARMDSDDLMHPERIATQVRRLQQNPKLDLLGTAAYIIDDQDRPSGIRGVRGRALGVGLPFTVFIHPTVMGRTEWFRRNPYDPGYVRAEDAELWFRTASSTCAENLEQPLFFYRDYGCFSLKKYLASGRTSRKILRKYGPALFGASNTMRKIAASHAKSAIFTVASALHYDDLLLKKRNCDLSPTEAREATRALDAILRTPVPGFAQRELTARH